MFYGKKIILQTCTSMVSMTKIPWWPSNSSLLWEANPSISFFFSFFFVKPRHDKARELHYTFQNFSSLTCGESICPIVFTFFFFFSFSPFYLKSHVMFNIFLICLQHIVSKNLFNSFFFTLSFFHIYQF